MRNKKRTATSQKTKKLSDNGSAPAVLDNYSFTVDPDRFLLELFRLKSETIWNRFQLWCNQFQQKESRLSNCKILFRGLANETYDLVPSSFRVRPYDIKKETYIFEEFVRQACSYYPDINHKTCIEKMAIAQHHGLPTRLLDWTSNPYVAAFFSCVGDREYYASASVCAVDVELQEPPVGNLLAMPPSKEVFVKTPVAFPRIERQEGYFSLHSNPYDEKTIDTVDRFVIPAYAKEYFLRKLRNFGISDKALMADLNGMSLTLSRDYSNITTKQLNGLLVSLLGDETIFLFKERELELAPVFSTNYSFRDVSCFRADKMEIVVAGVGKIYSVLSSASGDLAQPIAANIRALGERGNIIYILLRCVLNVYSQFMVKVNRSSEDVSIENISFKRTFVVDEHLQQATSKILARNEMFAAISFDGFVFTDAPHYDFENDLLTLQIDLISKKQNVAKVKLVLSGVRQKHPGSIEENMVANHYASLALPPEITFVEKDNNQNR